MMSKIIDDELKRIMNREERPLASVAAVAFRGGELLYEGYFGSRYIDPVDAARNLPVTPQTKFRVASISKLVATIGVMQLVQWGKLSLDQDVGKVLGFPIRNPHFADVPITLRMLLSHTSSIRDGDAAYSIALPQTIDSFFDPAHANYADGAHWGAVNEPPAEFFTYCNLNYGLIGSLIEIGSGLRFDRTMRGYVFGPLGVGASYNVRDFTTPEFGEDALDQIATLYRKRDAQNVWNPRGGWVPQVDNYRSDGAAHATLPTDGMRAENPSLDRLSSSDTLGRKYHDELRLEFDEDSQQNSVAKSASGFTNTPADLLASYELGSNGTLFSPQGGLRISARELAIIGMVLSSGGQLYDIQLLKPESMQQMLTPVWQFDGTNGDAYGGLMRAWGLGTQLITDSSAPKNGDRLVRDCAVDWIGHAGDAYGLHSGFWIDPASKFGMAYFIGGVGADPEQHVGEYSSFYVWEEEIATVLYQAGR